jgi:hypothetical protein
MKYLAVGVALASIVGAILAGTLGGSNASPDKPAPAVTPSATPNAPAPNAPNHAVTPTATQTATHNAPSHTATAPAPTPTAVPAKPAYVAALVKDVPHVKAKPGFAGEACAEMALRAAGKKWTQDEVFNTAGVDPNLGRGCTVAELGTVLGQIGLKVGAGSTKVSAAKADEEMEAQWRALHADLAAGVASIVSLQPDGALGAAASLRLVVGYDPDKDEVIYQDPAEADGAARRMKRPALLGLWPDKNGKDSWTVVRLRMDSSGKVSDPTARAEGHTPADYAQHMAALRKTLPAGYSAVLSAPFAVIGEGPPETVRRYADSTVRWSVVRLKADYFQKDPEDIIDVWLFKDDPTYRKGAKDIFGDNPSTPYGYYSSQHKALIMNIGTGGGTLVHEIVHPFMRTNFPSCPDWFNEGLASLYEQSEDRGGHIRGLTNWRLAGLQQAIKAGTLLSFKDLCATTTTQFYSQDKGNNYAQARYLCYYLQQKGLLTKYYREFTTNVKADPTGYKTLQRVLGEADMDKFQKDWQEYVTGLRFP